MATSRKPARSGKPRTAAPVSAAPAAATPAAVTPASVAPAPKKRTPAKRAAPLRPSAAAALPTLESPGLAPVDLAPAAPHLAEPAKLLRIQLPGALTRGAAPALPGAAGLPAGSTHRRVALGAVGPAKRDGAAASPQAVTLDVAADEVVKVELADGLVWWTRADDLLREHGQAPVAGAAGQRGQRSGAAAAADGVWTVSTGLNPASSGAPAQRGLANVAISALEFFGVDVSGAAARQLGAVLDKKRLGRTPGLYRVGLDDGSTAMTLLPEGELLPAGDAPVLVFLHGTMSSFDGSFGALRATAGANAKGATADELQAAAQARAALREAYGARIYALEHFTLTQSPVANALALAQRLPHGVRVHLVSHSRGGLVGELLCLAQRDTTTGDPVRDALAAGLFARGQINEAPAGLRALGKPDADALRSDYANDERDLDLLLQALDTAAPRIERYIRVACPARGTTLASGRLDRWLSVLGALAPEGFIGDTLDFLLKVVKERTDPRALPGIEAMMPASPLTQLLRWPTLRTAADLSAITGDLAPDRRWAQLKLLALDWFYSADHDLVVNTGSMAGGITRLPGKARFKLARGPLVQHFRYFTNPDSLGWLVQGLRRPEGATAGYLPIELAVQAEPRARAALRSSRDGSDRKAVAILVPGTMGSGLRVNDSGVWLRYGPLAFGGLGKIAIEAQGVEPDGLVDDFYAPLLEYLAPTHRLHSVAYDWRQSVRVAAQLLRAKLEDALTDAEQRKVPLRIVAHSMGGLVTRAMIADPDGARAWKRLQALPGSRLLMLGTPNAGSHEAVRWLTGFNPTERKLALLDLTRGTNAVIDIVRRYPGLAELLPFGHLAGERDYADPGLWTDLRERLEASFPPAGPDALSPARETWRLLTAQPDLSPEHVVYVAGHQPATVIDYQLTADPLAETWQPPKLEFIATPDGDGTVAWASGRLPGIAMYRAPDVAHDELCAATDDPNVFRGYLELLETGQTSRLPSLVLPAQRGRAGALADDRSRQFVLVEPPQSDFAPDEASLRGLSLGPGIRRKAKPVAVDAASSAPPVLRITIANGNLKFIQQPLLLGHYASSQLTGTEKVVDTLIGQAMSQALACGLYPEAPGTHQIFENRAEATLTAQQLPRPAQVIVAGLGSEGQLRLPALCNTVRQAVIALAQRHHDAGLTAPIELAATLLGSGGQGISAGTSAQAIALGVREANQRLAEANARLLGNGSNAGNGSEPGNPRAAWPLVGHIHLVELYLDRAAEAWQGLHPLAEGEPSAFALAPQVQSLLGARRRPSDPNYRGSNYDSITVRTVDEVLPAPVGDDLDAADGGDASAPAVAPGMRRRRSIAYSLDTRRARTEVSAQRTQAKLLRSLIREASNHDATDPSIGRTLWQLLIPPEIEAFLGGDAEQPGARANDLVMQLDDGTAGIPWELLDSRGVDAPDRKPWALRTRLLRRLDIATHGAPVRDARGDDPLLVIGEPLVDAALYGPLPGAYNEAKAVQQLLDDALGAGSGAVRALIGTAPGTGPQAREVITTLFERDWRVIHVAGHGAPGAEGGVVLSQGLVLGPNEVAAMRRVPELVFLNCCHLAAEDSSRTLAATDYDRPLFAAGLARALIEKGVRCVVAAGWAVDDQPAERFATSFYRAMVGGQRFIDAVHAAREAAWECDHRSNTWAAYQCYGDPDWTWRPGTPRDSAAPPNAAAASAKTIAEIVQAEGLDRVVSAQGLVFRLENLLLDARENAGQQPRIRSVLGAITATFGPVWGGMGAVAEALGLAWAEAGDTAKGIEWLQKATAAPDGSASWRAIEQLCNLQARSASPSQPQQARAQIAAVITKLQQLIGLQDSMERQCLLGSAWKRLAMIERVVAAGQGGGARGKGKAAAAAAAATQAAGEGAADASADPTTATRAERIALEAGAAAYARAEALARQEAATNLHYPASNALALQLRLSLLNGALPPAPADDAMLAVTRSLAQQNLSAPDFWSVVGDSELRVMVALCQQRVAEIWPTIRVALDDLHTRQPAAQQWASVRDQAELLLVPYLAIEGLPESEVLAVGALRERLGLFSR